MTQDFYDVVIIGAGVVGCAIARELSKLQLDVAVLEKDRDVAGGASGRNSGVVHAGFNNIHGSFKAKFCVAGNAMFEGVCRELDVPYRKTGKLVVALEENDLPVLKKLKAAGELNGVPDLEIIDSAAIKKLEPHVNGIAALFSGSTAITSPFMYTVALGEVAATNGVKFHFATKVTGIKRKEFFEIRSGKKTFRAKVVINSAGAYSDKIAGMVGINDNKLFPCRGQYHILDKHASQWLSRPVYPLPRLDSGGLGVHLTTTVDDNVLIGPSAEFIGSRCDHATTGKIMKQLFAEAAELLPPLSPKYIIRSYSGIRAKLTPPGFGSIRDFVIEDSKAVPGFINLVGIESPGLTSAVPIAEFVSGMLANHFSPRKKNDFRGKRSGIKRFAEMSSQERQKQIENNPDFGEIVCRCEQVSRKEIIEAIENPLKVKTLSGIKYRARSMMGRCQGGYCLTRIVDILTREYGIPPEEILERNRDSRLFTGWAKKN